MIIHSQFFFHSCYFSCKGCSQLENLESDFLWDIIKVKVKEKWCHSILHITTVLIFAASKFVGTDQMTWNLLCVIYRASNEIIFHTSFSPGFLLMSVQIWKYLSLSFSLEYIYFITNLRFGLSNRSKFYLTMEIYIWKLLLCHISWSEVFQESTI